MLSTESRGTLDRLIDSLLSELPGVLEPMVRAAVWDVVDDFCARTGYYRKIVPWTLTANRLSVQLVSTAIGLPLIQQVVEVYGLDQYRVEQPDTLIPLEPTIANGTALVTVRPADLETTPEFVFSTWFRHLRDGALARLMSEPLKPYSNPEVAQAFATLFEQGIVRAGSQAPQVVGIAALRNDGVDRLYTNIVAELGDVPHTQIQMAAWNAIEEFFIRSTVRRERVCWCMPTGICEVDFDPFDGDWDVAWVLGYSGLTSGGISPPGALRDFQQTPTGDRSGEAILALKPHDFASDFGTMLWAQWFNFIKAGTLYLLYSQPGRAYSSPQLATFYGRRFRAGISEAKAYASRGYTDGASWLFPYYATGRRKS